MERFWSKRLEGVTPYIPGEQPRGQRFIKLNTNENPYPPSPRVREALLSWNVDDARLYPDPECLELRRAIGEKEGLAPEQVFVGNGSDEVLAFAFAALFDQGEECLFPALTYSFYPIYAKLWGVGCRTVPLNDDLSVPVERLAPPNCGVVLANPNAPTCLALPLSAVEQVLRQNPDRAVIVDEAYVDFGGETAVPLIARYPNLLITRTMSKSAALAGLRVGYALGDSGLIRALEAVKNSFNSYTMDRCALLAAQAAVEDWGYYRETIARITAERDRAIPRLRELGFALTDSKTNFLFMRHPGHSGAALFAALRERGILVRHFSHSGIEDYIRVTVGTGEEMEALFSALGDILTQG